MKKLTPEIMSDICTYMNDDIREQVHSGLVPCTLEEFLKRYLELDSDFMNLLKSEFKYIL